jgi:hypothetical protein
VKRQLQRSPLDDIGFMVQVQYPANCQIFSVLHWTILFVALCRFQMTGALDIFVKDTLANLVCLLNALPVSTVKRWQERCLGSVVLISSTD